jgi:hypothetical protein
MNGRRKKNNGRNKTLANNYKNNRKYRKYYSLIERPELS